MGDVHLPFCQQLQFPDDCLSCRRIAQDTGPKAAVQVFLYGPEILMLQCSKLFGSRFDGMQMSADFLEPGDHIVWKTVGAPHRYEVTPTFHLQMREVSPGETNRARQSHDLRSSAGLRSAQ
jgi:hypothetical protein